MTTETGNRIATIVAKLPRYCSPEQIHEAGGPRGQVIRRWLRDNIPGWRSRKERNIVLDRDVDVPALLARIGSGAASGTREPDSADVSLLRAGLDRMHVKVTEAVPGVTETMLAAADASDAAKKAEQARLDAIVKSRESQTGTSTVPPKGR